MADLELNVSQQDARHELAGQVITEKTPSALHRPVSGATELADPHGKYPEGGTRAWLVVLGSWCAMVPAMGMLNTIGALHAWTSTHQLAGYSDSSIGWIFGAFSFFLNFGSAQVGR